VTLKYDEHGHPYEDLTEENKKLKKRIQELDNSLSIALDINDKYQRESAALMKNRPLDTMDEVAYRELQAENEKLKKRAQEAEGETSIVKGIGTNSPEMKALKERVKELDNSLAIALEINESHQRYNGKLQTRVTELEEDNKKLSHQVEDKIGMLREKGLM